jgi:hypothetical protein
MLMQSVEKSILAFDEMTLAQQKLEKLPFPTFLGVGAGRCGTTSIYDYLNRHPGVYMSPVKEINYFGVRSRSETRQRGLTVENYALFFSGHKNEKHIGEVSPIYLNQAGAALEILAALGKIKIVIQIREPVSRFLSQYKHHLNQHKIQILTEYVAVALRFAEFKSQRLNMDWFHPAKNLLQSFYADHIQTYFDLFGKENVLVIIYDDLAVSPQNVARKLCEFLDVPVPDFEMRAQNQSVGNLGGTDYHLAALQAVFDDDIDRTEKIVGRKLWSKSIAA